MSTDQAFRKGVKGGGAWRAEIGARIDELANRLDAVPTEDWDAQKKAVEKTVEGELERAHRATETGWSPLGWWTGSSLTKAWEAVHNAELALLKIETHVSVLSAVPRLLSWVQRAMDSGATREEHETALRTEMKKEEKDGSAEPAPDRMKIRAALADVIGANGRRYAAVRTFRNNLIMVMLLLVAVLLGIAIWHAINPQFLPLCREVSEVKEGKEVTEQCVTGTSAQPWDIWILLLVGAFGGVLGIAFGFSETEEAARYDPRTWQTFLKPVTGAATALAAVIFLQSGVAIELTIKGSAAIIGYALLFGFSQQLLTKMVDKKAESLITPTAK